MFESHGNFMDVECRGRTHCERRYEVLTYYQGLLKVQFVCDFDLENYHNKANILY